MQPLELHSITPEMSFKHQIIMFCLNRKVYYLMFGHWGSRGNHREM